MVIHLPHDHGGFGIEGGVWRPKRLSVTALAGIYFFLNTAAVQQLGEEKYTPWG